MTFLFASATQIGTISLLLGGTSVMYGFVDTEVIIELVVGVAFLLVYGIVFQALSLYHLVHSLYVFFAFALALSALLCSRLAVAVAVAVAWWHLILDTRQLF